MNGGGSVALLAVTAALLAVAAGHIIAIDLGSDSMKVALVKPGMPFQVVNNFQSKRKVCRVPGLAPCGLSESVHSPRHPRLHVSVVRALWPSGAGHRRLLRSRFTTVSGL